MSTNTKWSEYLKIFWPFTFTNTSGIFIHLITVMYWLSNLVEKYAPMAGYLKSS